MLHNSGKQCLPCGIISAGEIEMNELEGDVTNITHHFSSALLHNPLAVRDALSQCRDTDGAYNMLNVVEYLLKLPNVRSCLEKTTCQGNNAVMHTDVMPLIVSKVIPNVIIFIDTV